MLLLLRVPAIYPDDASTSVSMRWLVKDRFMWLLAGLIFIGMGVYNAVATWLQPVLANFGEGGAAGNLIAVLTAGGIVGAAVLPPIVAARDQRRTMLVVALAFSAVAFAATDLRHDVVWLGVWFFATGIRDHGVPAGRARLVGGPRGDGARRCCRRVPADVRQPRRRGARPGDPGVDGQRLSCRSPRWRSSACSGMPLALGLPGDGHVARSTPRRTVATLDGER